MRVSSRLLVPPAMAIAPTAAVVAIAIILLAASFIITYAQQQPPPQTSQPTATQSPTLLSIKDSFRVQLPQGWVIQDVNNTGFTLAAEVLQGYGILAQLCPHEEQQQSALPSVGGSNTYIGSCQQAREEVIHILRYPNLGARLGIFSDDDILTIINRDTIPNAILAYHIQKLQEVGYQDIQIVNSRDMTIDVDISTGQSNNRTAVPAKLVEMTYSTTLNDTKRGYFILTATAATPRNLGTMTGYSIFYEGNSATTAETRPSGSLAPILLPAPVRQVFDSFELIAVSTVPLTAVITSSDTEGGVAPATFEFEADVTGGTEPYTISWDFGDGSSEENDDNDDDVEYTFDVAGTYNVDLTVTDSSGRTASDSMSITVEEPPPLTSVDIISNGTEGVAPATFEFEANLTGGAEPFTYIWNFGDGSSEENDDETVEHTFDVAGTYNVDLTVIDSTSQTASDSILITVEEPSLSPTPPITEEPVCDPSYPDLCIPPPPPDLGCDDISARNFEVLPPDLHVFDGDNDGIGCEIGVNQPGLEPEQPNDDGITFGGIGSDADDDGFIDDEFIDDDGA